MLDTPGPGGVDRQGVAAVRYAAWRGVAGSGSAALPSPSRCSPRGGDECEPMTQPLRPTWPTWPTCSPLPRLAGRCATLGQTWPDLARFDPRAPRMVRIGLAWRPPRPAPTLASLALQTCRARMTRRVGSGKHGGRAPLGPVGLLGGPRPAPTRLDPALTPPPKGEGWRGHRPLLASLT